MPVFLLMDKQVKRECISCDLQGSFSCLPFLLLILLLLRQFFVITLDFITRSELKNWPGSLIPTKCQECMTEPQKGGMLGGGGGHGERRRGTCRKEEGGMWERGVKMLLSPLCYRNSDTCKLWQWCAIGFFTHVTDIIPFLFLGSGKTYTMMGSQNQTGLIPRLCNELFDRISSVS